MSTTLAFGAALIPILFAYGGWQNANYVAEEMKDPERHLPRSLISAFAPALGGYLLQHSTFGWPLVLGGAIKAVIIILDDGERPLSDHGGGKPAAAGGEARAGADGQGVRFILRQSVLLCMLVAQPRLGDRLEGELLGASGPCDGQCGRRCEQIFHEQSSPLGRRMADADMGERPFVAAAPSPVQMRAPVVQLARHLALTSRTPSSARSARTVSAAGRVSNWTR